MRQIVITIYIALFSTLFGTMFSAQILGFLGLYTAPIAIPLSIALSILAYYFYQSTGQVWLEKIQSEKSPNTLLRNVIILICILIVSIVFVQRMILFPHSELGRFISVDFTSYHSLKALDLYYSATVWDLSIPYGQYPFGYEGLIAFGFMLTGDIRVVGMVHAVVFVLLWLTLALLLLRLSKVSLEISLLVSLALCFLPIVFPQLLNIGKNDTLLSLTILIAVLHAPLNENGWHPLGLAMATMLSLATKATGLYVLFYLWGLVMLQWGLAFRKNQWREYLSIKLFVVCIAVMFVGGLWVIRNYVMMGEVFTSEISSFFQTTIAANFDNPVLYSSGYHSQSLLIGAITVLVLSIVSLFKTKLGWQTAGLLLVMAGTFIITPLGAFLTINNLDYMAVQWRFVLFGILMCVVLIFVFAMPIVMQVYTWLADQFSIVAIVALLLGMIVLLSGLGIDDLFNYDASRLEQFYDPTEQENSIYDAIETLSEGTLYIEGLEWLPIMLRHPDMHITELRYPLGRSDLYPDESLDYIVQGSPVLNNVPNIPAFNPDEWQIIYDDSTGRIYQRIP